MKALLSIGILWCGLAQAHVASPLSPAHSDPAAPAQMVAQDGKSLMDQVVDWYAAGQDITFAEAKGYYVGRCFSFDEPNKGKNGLFSPLSVNNGPGFPEQPKILADVSWQRGVPADHYDTFIKASEVSNTFWDIYKDELTNSKHYGPITENPLQELFDIEGNGRVDFRINIRKSGDYLVYTVTNLIAQKLDIQMMSKPTYANAGQVVYACYYFKKLAE